MIRSWLKRRALRRAGRARCVLSRAAATGDLAKALAAPLPPFGTPFQRLRLLAVDLEMTGLNPERDDIVSIGWVPIDAGRIRLVGASHLLVAGDGTVGSSAVVHGIFDDDRRQGVEPGEVLERFSLAAAGRVLVMHHAPLDLAFLNELLRSQLGGTLAESAIDTLELEARRRARRGQSVIAGAMQLPALRAAYGLPPMRMHNALNDAIATAELLLAMAAGQDLRLADLI